MTVVEFHPEDLLDLARRGTLSDDQRRRLADHLAKCSVCAFELEAAAAFALEGRERAEDGALLARLEAAALAGVEDTGVDRAPGGSPPRSFAASGAPSAVDGARAERASVGFPLGIAAAFALACLAGGTAAALWIAVTRSRVAEAPPPSVGVRRRVVPTPAPPPVEAPPALGSADAGVLFDGAVADAATEALDGSAPQRKGRVAPTAAALLERADALRRAGRLRDAERTYRLLQRRFPSSREHDVSRVSLGRLLLDRRGHARAALREFDAYLAKARGGTLAEEARVGRALAFDAIGDGPRARTAWEALIAHHPESAYVAKARARLAELAK